MQIGYGDSSVSISDIDLVIDAMVKSENLKDFCRAIVHSEFTESSVQGCQIYFLDGESHFKPVAGYGKTYLDTEISLSAWDDNPIATCVRNKAPELKYAEVGSELGVLAVPLLRDEIPIGVLVVAFDRLSSHPPVSENLIPSLSKLGSFCLVTFAQPNFGKSGGFSVGTSEHDGDDLTTRQIKILELIAYGMVNAEIARELMLSESTIRQETVRIYRSLGVPNRSEAAKKGKSLGLIKAA